MLCFTHNQSRLRSLCANEDLEGQMFIGDAAGTSSPFSASPHRRPHGVTHHRDPALTLQGSCILPCLHYLSLHSQRCCSWGCRGVGVPTTGRRRKSSLAIQGWVGRGRCCQDTRGNPATCQHLIVTHRHVPARGFAQVFRRRNAPKDKLKSCPSTKSQQVLELIFCHQNPPQHLPGPEPHARGSSTGSRQPRRCRWLLGVCKSL